MQEIQSYTEGELVAALKEHKNEAYRYLYLHYRGSLYNVITQVIADTETANDVLQEVFVTIWKNIHMYNAEKGRLFTWMLKLTRNVTINQTRVKNYQMHRQNGGIDNYVNYIEAKDPQQMDINQIGLRKQVHQLRQEYKDVLELSYFQGFKQEKIAKTLGIPIGTVKTRLRNAIIELRKQFV